MHTFYLDISHICLIYFFGNFLGTLRPRLGEENWMEWKWTKIIILEYSSSPLFGSFNGENEKFILLFESLSGRE